jgi:cytochrome c oxidase subunit 2
MKQPPKDAFVINSSARMWSWSFKYPNGKTTDTLYVPLGKPVRINLTSLDVIHSMYIPAFRLKQDMVPGSNYFLWFVAQKQGVFEIFCAEFCGMQHSYMQTRIVVMPERAFDKWYKDTSLIVETTSSGKPIMPGLSIIKKNGCVACHSFDGSKIVGPSFKGIYGEKTTVLVDGKEQQVSVDDDYILESIYEPNAKIVKGFQKGLMQPYKDLIKKEEVKQIADYIKSLK